MPIASPLSSYSDTTLHKRTITDTISIIDPRDTPLIENLGGLDGAASKFNFVNSPNTVVEWAEDTLFALTDSITETLATDTTTLTVADATKFQEGDILLVTAEQMWVSAYTNATSVVVTRSFGASAATTHADNAVVYLIGQARLEGDDSDDRAFTDKTTNSNYSQIFHHEVKVSGTMRVVPQYGVADEFEYQSEKQVPSLLRLIERNAFYSDERAAGSATTARRMGGLPVFVTDNLEDYASAITQADFEDALEASWGDGGMGPWQGYVNGANFQVIKGFYDNTSYLRVDRGERTAGMVIDTIVTPFGEADLILDRWARTDRLELIDPQHAGFLTLRPFAVEPLAKTGDSERAEVVGEFSLCVRQDKAHACLTT